MLQILYSQVLQFKRKIIDLLIVSVQKNQTIHRLKTMTMWPEKQIKELKQKIDSNRKNSVKTHSLNKGLRIILASDSYFINNQKLYFTLII